MCLLILEVGGGGGATVLSLISMVGRKLSLDAPEKNVCSSVVLFTTGLTVTFS